MYPNQSPKLKSRTEEIAVERAVEQYYAVYYTEQWYIGRILEIEGDMYTVKFLHHFMNNFVWPRRDDVAKVKSQYLFCGSLKVNIYKDLRKKESS